MSQNCLHPKDKATTDIPINGELDWLDDFYNVLDRIDPRELRRVSSIAELALHLSLNGFSREDMDISEGDIWYGLVTWIQHLTIRSSLMKININSVYGGFRILKENGGVLEREQASKLMYKIAADTYGKKDAGFSIVFACLREFANVDQASREQVFEFFTRMRGSNAELDAFSEKFMKELTKISVPENDIPEA